MKSSFAQHLRFCTLITTLAFTCWPPAQADPIPVRHEQGTIHGFLELRSEGGVVVASGDIVQFVRGDRITSETVFRFKDGSIDDETTVFSQHHV